MKIIEPSLLSINKEKTAEQLQQIKKFDLGFVHYDVMDGKFVPPTALTTEYLDELEKLNIKPNVHLMVEKPAEWIAKYKNYAVNSITFHAESQSIQESIELLKQIKQLGFLAGFAVKPSTDLNKYKELSAHCDVVLVMSVEPGYAGQGFLDKALSNLKIANDIKKQNPNIIIEIDGGINDKYIKQLYQQVDWFVTGSWFFKNIGHMDQYLNEFKKLK